MYNYAFPSDVFRGGWMPLRECVAAVCRPRHMLPCERIMKKFAYSDYFV